MRYTVFAFFAACFFIILPVQAATAPPTAAQQAIVIDVQTGQVLLDKNADKRMPTSSMSKVMTMYSVFEALKDGRLSLDQKLPVSEKAWRMGGSKMFVEVGKEVRTEDLIRGVIVQSGNDATVVLAEYLGGTEETFAVALTEKAKDLGMTNSRFANASGWPDPDHYSTARDLALLGIRLIEDFPDFYPYYAEKEFTFNAIKQDNRNPLLYKNIGADGIKTGHTEAGGYGLMASGVRDGRRVVAVLNGMDSVQERASESAKILDWALRNFQNITLFKAQETVETIPVRMGQAKSVPLNLEQDLTLTVPKIHKENIKADVVYDGPLEAPVHKGQEIGRLVISVPGMEPVERPLIAGADVPRLGFFAGALEQMKLYITELLSRW